MCKVLGQLHVSMLKELDTKSTLWDINQNNLTLVLCMSSKNNFFMTLRVT